jgi:predicted metal-binding protein
MDDCGGCPGLVIPKLALMMDMGKLYNRDFDAVHFGTCIMKATQTAKCPIDVEDLKKKIETKLKKEVILGTHPY